jgi:hypothetical protein
MRYNLSLGMRCNNQVIPWLPGLQFPRGVPHGHAGVPRIGLARPVDASIPAH